MSLNLKIKLVAEDLTKVLRFNEKMSVHEATKYIFEKTNVGGKDHGLFFPSLESDTSSVGQWLKPEKTLEFYDLNQNEILEYKKKHDIIKIKMVDETLKTMLLDTSLPCSEIVSIICKKIGIKNPEEFALQAEQKPGAWLKNSQSIPEQVGTMDQVFIIKKKFFLSDSTVSQDDPVQLHLVYCQSRDDIVAGKHPCTKDEIVQFAALQAQLQVGNYNPEIHKPGYINQKEFFPPQYRNKEMEKRMIEEWKKLVGMTEVNARYRYVQLCRSLKTYGMTVFKVKDKIPGKKKLSESLLCFTRNSILRMEYETKKVIKEYPFKHLLRWAASAETFTMDFGAYEEDYVVVLTQEGEAISNLVAGYIDLLLKKQKESEVVIEDDGSDVATVDETTRVGGIAHSSYSTSNTTAQYSYATGVVDCATGSKAIERMIGDLFGAVEAVEANNNLTPDQRQRQIADHAKTLQSLAETLENFSKSGDRAAMNSSAAKMVQSCEALITAARQAAASGQDPDGVLLASAKAVSDALKKLINASQECANKPRDPEAKEALLQARQAAQAALQKLSAASRGVYADHGYQALFKEMAKAVALESEELVSQARAAEATITDPTKKQMVSQANESLVSANKHLLSLAEILAPTAQDEECKLTIERAGKGLEQSAAYVVATAKSSGIESGISDSLATSQQRLQEALQRLLGIAELPEMKDAKESSDFTEAAQTILSSSAALMASQGNPNTISQNAKTLKEATTRLGIAGKGVLATVSSGQRERMGNYLKQVVESTRGLLQVVPACTSNPNDVGAQKQLREKAQEVAEATQLLLGDSGKQVALAALYSSAKLAAAQTTNLCTTSRSAKVGNQQTRDQLDAAAKAAAEAVQKLVAVLKSARPLEDRTRGTNLTGKARAKSIVINDDLMTGCETFAPTAYKLVSASKAATNHISDSDNKQAVVYSSGAAAKAIHTMLANRKALKAVKGQIQSSEAVEDFKASLADLEAAIVAADTGILKGNKTKDEALADLAQATQELGKSTKSLITTAKNSPEDIGESMKTLSTSTRKAITATSDLAAAIEDKALQKGLLNAVKGVATEIQSLMSISKASASNPEDENLNKALLESGKSVVGSLVKLTEASKGVVPKKIEDFQKKAAADIEDQAEKELAGAAKAIEGCVKKLQAATQAARERMAAKGIDVDEQNITEAILEAAQAIAQSTGNLVTAATAVQQEYTKLVKAPSTGPVYKRDPQWAQGLISAARTVAGTVQHLVGAANSAAQGEASEEALVVAAQAVSAATTQLVVASTVKSDPNSQSTTKLKEAASKVSQATSALVEAARSAAQWEEEQLAMEEDSKYSLAESKIKEMEKQMEILRLEKELQKARQGLGNMRKNEYTKAVDPTFKPGGSSGNPNPKPSSPPPSAGRGRGRPLPQPNWRSSGLPQKKP